MTYEDLGVRDQGDAPKLIGSRGTASGGRLPVNSSRTLEARCHPPGAKKVAQCAEIFEQLWGTDANQLDAARIGICHKVAGPTTASAIVILEGPAR